MRGAQLAACAAVLLAAAGCQQQERQDADEPRGRFAVEARASFPERQSLAQRSNLVVRVRNVGRRTIPNVAVTLAGLQYKDAQPEVADPRRPVWVINGRHTQIGGFPESKQQQPRGGDTSYLDTWALGKLAPNQRKTFRWSLTAVRAGVWRLGWEVAAGLHGRARAVDRVDPGSGAPRGSFRVRVTDRVPQTRVADDGETIVRGTR